AQLDRLEPCGSRGARGLEQEQGSRRAPGEALVVADLEQPEPARVLDGELDRGRLLSDAQPADPERPGPGGRGRVLLEELPSPRILRESGSARTLPPGGLDLEDLGQERLR